MDDAMDEIITLVDAHDTPLGGAAKGQVHREGLLHRAFSVFVFNAAGEMLLQRRAAGKYHSPGLWSNSCCGHPRLGEALADAAARRLDEELGLKVALREVGVTTYRTEFDNGLIENELVHLLVGQAAGEVAANPDEVWEVAWAAPEAVVRRMGEAPAEFTYWFRHYVAEGAGWF